ncbi:hypothetical protein A2Y83_04580 [Candidatus Falkowbacteria bacterium RBG_13_39_14]|uniref:Uncharacterized protein n=1 Tax=Candidatus Falkowbacteria bacterium RBG_13_39_14 TaxID=1797985 RepID=A0A1F5S7I8_9BACT|nr:MAG: hypothetical protein A2Y83_04580 [Candidatus Falkowbacteria bacterium RBG_13_39_14]
MLKRCGIKIEKTSKDTIIGLSNGKRFTVVIKRRVKRKLQEDFRRQGKPQLFYYRTFMAGVALLIKYAEIENAQEIVIDREYSGKEKMFRSMFFEMAGKYFKNVPEVRIEEIGRRSKAHIVSYETMKGKIKPDKEITYNDIRRLSLRQ